MNEPDRRDGADERRRAQLGVETLVVFIAMVLVAATAAALLVQTAGLLQNQSHATSEDSEDQIANRLLLISAVGTINETGDRRLVETINVTVMVGPGADDVDLAKASVDYLGPDTHETRTYAATPTSPDPAAAEFGIHPVADPDGSAPVLTTRQDRLVIEVPLEADEQLTAGDRARIKVVTESGSSQVHVVAVPQTLSQFDDGDAVAV